MKIKQLLSILVLFVFVISSVQAIDFFSLAYYSPTYFDSLQCKEKLSDMRSLGYSDCSIKYSGDSCWVRCNSYESSSETEACSPYEKLVCKDGDVYLKSRDKYCDIDYSKVKDCDFGCESGKCINPSPDWHITDVEIRSVDGSISPNEFISIIASVENRGSADMIKLECGVYGYYYVTNEGLNMVSNPVPNCYESESFVDTVELTSEGKDAGKFSTYVLVPTKFDVYGSPVYTAVNDFDKEMYVICGLYYTCGGGYVDYIKKKITLEAPDVIEDNNEDTTEEVDKDTLLEHQDEYNISFFELKELKYTYDEETQKIKVVGRGKFNHYGNYLVGAYIDDMTYKPLTWFSDKNVCDKIIGTEVNVITEKEDDFEFLLPLPEKSGYYKIKFVVTDGCNEGNYNVLFEDSLDLKLEIQNLDAGAKLYKVSIGEEVSNSLKYLVIGVFLSVGFVLLFLKHKRLI